jgi:NAD(P)H-dependent flavin oxidoreductase YrpB (nitropropane dioxygenase family)
MSEGCIVQSPISIDAVSNPSLVEAQSNAVAVDVEQLPIAVEIIQSPIAIDVETSPVVVEVLQNALITVPAIVGYEDFNIETNGQTVFDLPYAIANPDKSRLYLNGQKQVYGVDYTINASVLTYSGVTLETTDYFEIYW